MTEENTQTGKKEYIPPKVEDYGTAQQQTLTGSGAIGDFVGCS